MNLSIIDITYPLSKDLPCWPGSVGFVSKWNLRMPASVNNASSFAMDSHLGSHLDAPLHFVQSGKAIHELDLYKLIGEAYVAEIRNVDLIKASHLESAGIPAGCKRLLLKTDNQSYWQKGLTQFQENFSAIDVSAAKWIIEHGIFLIGIDYLSIQRFNDGPEVHQILLSAEVVIVETLNLEDVQSGTYELICLPIKVRDLEGAPVRAVLRKF
jgi:arylformamidase